MKIQELFKVKDYAVIVTGGASGIGLGYAEALAENGARVTILDVSAGGIESEIKRLTGAGFDVRGDVVDVTDRQALDRAFDAAVEEYGKLDVVFANAGIDSGPGFFNNWGPPGQARDPEGALENYSDERWNRVIEINLNGVFATLRAAARHMRPRKSGSIIVTTSLASTICETAIGDAYMTAKAGAAHLMRNVALELAAYNIKVNAIAPGFIVTNIGGGHAKNPDVQEQLGKMVPMHRVGFPEDLKGLALFLASPASGYITGQEIVIDGGRHLGPAD